MKIGLPASLATSSKRMIRLGVTAALCLCGSAAVLSQDVRTQRQVVSDFVERSMRTRVWFYHAFDESCTLVRGFNVAVARMPKHGDVALLKEERVIDESFINVRDSFANIQQVRRCFGRPMPVIVLYYTGKQGYSGFDDLETVVTTADRLSQRVIEFRIGVQ